MWTLYFAESFYHIRRTQSCQRYVIFVVTDTHTHTPVVPSSAVCQILPSFLINQLLLQKKTLWTAPLPEGLEFVEASSVWGTTKGSFLGFTGLGWGSAHLHLCQHVSCLWFYLVENISSQECVDLGGRWRKHQVFPPSSFDSRGSVCLHHSSHDSTFLYAICFAHCVHIYIDVMHIFYTCVTSWELYFVNTKDVYKYCLLCVNKGWWNVTFVCFNITQKLPEHS